MDYDKLWNGLLTLGAGVAVAIFNGFVLSVTWGWFVEPLFPVPDLVLMEAMGLALVVNYLTVSPSRSDERAVPLIVFTSLVRSVLALALGFVFTLFL